METNKQTETDKSLAKFRATETFSINLQVIESESGLSNATGYSQNHAERIAYLETLIKAIEKNKRVGSFLFRVGCGSALITFLIAVEATLNTSITITNLTTVYFISLILLPFVALIVLGLFLSRYRVGRLEELKKEYYELFSLKRYSEKNLKT